MLLTDIGYGLSGLLGLGIIFIGTRFLLAPQVAAADFGIATGPQGGQLQPGRPPFGARRQRCYRRIGQGRARPGRHRL